MCFVVPGWCVALGACVTTRKWAAPPRWLLILLVSWLSLQTLVVRGSVSVVWRCSFVRVITTVSFVALGLAMAWTERVCRKPWYRFSRMARSTVLATLVRRALGSFTRSTRICMKALLTTRSLDLGSRRRTLVIWLQAEPLIGSTVRLVVFDW